jgi:hypothetical protein
MGGEDPTATMSRALEIPQLIASGRVHVDVALNLQGSSPGSAGVAVAV